MASSTLTDLLIGLAVIVYLCSQQLRWRPVDGARRWKMPFILGAAGVISIARQNTTFHPVDVAILGLSAVFALISGALMGQIARFRPSPTDARLVESRTGALGIVIWIGLIAVRVALDLVGHQLGSDLAVSTGSILLVLALNRATSAVVVSARQPHRGYALAGK